jgi:hypothetical protein
MFFLIITYCYLSYGYNTVHYTELYDIASQLDQEQVDNQGDSNYIHNTDQQHSKLKDDFR